MGKKALIFLFFLFIYFFFYLKFVSRKPAVSPQRAEFLSRFYLNLNCMFQDFPRKTSTWPATNLKPAGGAKSASYTLKLALVLSDEGVSITYVFFSWTKTTWFSCRAFNHMSPLSLPLYLTAAGAYFCRKQAEHFSAANMSNASARTQLGAQCQDCIARLLICMWPQITQAAWQDLKVLER